MGTGFFSRENPLFFRKGGELDFGPAVWASAFVVGVVLLFLDASDTINVSALGWTFLIVLTALTSLAGASLDRATLIAKSKPWEIAGRRGGDGWRDGYDYSYYPSSFGGRGSSRVDNPEDPEGDL